MDNEKIGIYLQELRLNKNYTQAKVAQICNVTHQAVSQWENGKSLPDLDAMKSLSELYSLSINEIIGCERIDSSNIKNPNINVGITDKLSSETLMVFLVSIVACVLSFILVIGGMSSGVLPLMILPALFISLFQSIYIYLKSRKNQIDKIFHSSINVVTTISLVFLIISLVIFIAFIGNGLDAFGFLQPIIYSILTYIYFKYGKKVIQELEKI
ncbi:MAG: helix-turn-helix domain-containing protein [Tenericutes bacterium]|nr:helix-turn-helix domain-containing protein [Mycoplasmatota bacterium]